MCIETQYLIDLCSFEEDIACSSMCFFIELLQMIVLSTIASANEKICSYFPIERIYSMQHDRFKK